METQELINALANVNINSESAEKIANAWLRLQYIKMILGELAGWTVFGCISWGIHSAWKHFAAKDRSA